MRKLFTLLMIVVATVAAQSQVLIYEAHEAEMTQTENWKDAKTFEVDPGLLIVVNLEDETIKISNNYDDKFFITASEEFTQESGDYVEKNIIFTCYDKEGRKCHTSISYYTSDNVGYAGKYDVRVRVFYNDLWYGYDCTIKSMTGV